MFRILKSVSAYSFLLIFRPFPPPILTFALGEHFSFEGFGPPPQKVAIWFFSSELEEHLYEEFMSWRILTVLPKVCL